MMARKNKKARVAVLISGRGSNLIALCDAARESDFPAEISLVISNNPDALGLNFSTSLGIKACTLNNRSFGKDRAAYDSALQELLIANDIEYVCLAGFMRILTPEFCEKWSARIINIHPSLLPSFPGLDTHKRALEAGVRFHGCTTHFVIPALDAGPIILQAIVPIFDEDDENILAARILEQEHIIFPQSLRLLVENRLEIVKNRVFFHN